MNHDTFLALVRAGLWVDVVKVNGFLQNDFDSAELKAVPKGLADGLKVKDYPETIDYDEVLRLAEEQAVTGLVTAGLERFTAYRLPLTVKLTLLGKCQLIEQRNTAMNRLTKALVKKLQDVGIKVLLVKGQGIAQCYARPLWRTSGDIDLFFSKEDYPKAVESLSPLATKRVQDAKYTKSYGLTIDGWFVELHGSLRNSLSSRMDKVIDEVQKDTFENEKVRACRIGEVEVLMPCVNNDLFLLFAHFVRHFYKGGFSLRQLCDWCRLMWTYRDEIDSSLLENRLHRAGIMTEWKAFAAVAVDYIGFPQEAMPLYDKRAKWHQKAALIIERLFSKETKISTRKVFPANTLKYMPALRLNVNGLKIKEKLIG